MTKRDYELIARCIREVRYDTTITVPVLDALTALFAVTLREGNLRFNMERFKNATYDEHKERERATREASLEQDASWLRSL